VGELLTYASLESVNPFRVDAPEIDLAAFERTRRRVIDGLGLAPLLERGVLELSQGERRLLLLARALCRAPRLLLADDPWTGLDAARRERAGALLAEAVAEGRKVVIATRRGDEIPEWVTHVLRLEALRAVEAGPRARVCAGLPEAVVPTVELRPRPDRGRVPGEPLIEMRGVHVRYGAKTILDGVDWTVRSGEHWAVVGANGAGKSTLLSLILGDNPQAYANDVRLFGRPRGSGETIWDLRRRIGWMGPELAAHFPAAACLLDVVCSGFSGTLGRVDRPTPEQLARAGELLRLFGVGGLACRALGETGDAEQRLALIARALVHAPALLILDEPCQGLDRARVALVRDAVDAAAAHGVESVVYVTHEARERPSCINRTLVLDANGSLAGPHT
jgi:molybdate transport system ATP-binding protein